MYLSVRMQTPADLSKFLQDSPESRITSLASPVVERTQVPVRIHPEIYMVMVTVQKNKLQRILGEEGGGESEAPGRSGRSRRKIPPPTPKAHEDKAIQLGCWLLAINGAPICQAST